MNQDVFPLTKALALDKFYVHIAFVLECPHDYSVSLFSIEMDTSTSFCQKTKYLHLEVSSTTWKRAERFLEAVLSRSQHRICNVLNVINILIVEEEYLAVRGVQFCS